MKDDLLLTNLKIKKSGIYWLIKCQLVVANRVLSEEFSRDGYLINLPIEGSFFEISDSPWMKEFDDEKVLSKCKQRVFDFYDEIIEIIAQNLYLPNLKKNL